MTTFTRSKEQHSALVARAAALVEQGQSYRAVRAALVVEFGCSKTAAHRAYWKVKNGDGDNWGGRREGAGRPAARLEEPGPQLDRRKGRD